MSAALGLTNQPGSREASVEGAEAEVLDEEEAPRGESPFRLDINCELRRAADGM
ncbi:hypothetical protein [Sorangium sp. So ce1097]|uniref:hypothetical protein n=1 Tax=Sorangium sp. So ce1097 TaxID=3133330 RepID=UPI003F60462C